MESWELYYRHSDSTGAYSHGGIRYSHTGPFGSPPETPRGKSEGEPPKSPDLAKQHADQQVEDAD